MLKVVCFCYCEKSKLNAIQDGAVRFFANCVGFAIWYHLFFPTDSLLEYTNLYHG